MLNITPKRRLVSAKAKMDDVRDHLKTRTLLSRGKIPHTGLGTGLNTESGDK